MPQYLIVSDSTEGQHVRRVTDANMLGRYIEAILLLGDTIAYVVPYTDELARMYRNAGQRIQIDGTIDLTE